MNPQRVAVFIDNSNILQTIHHLRKIGDEKWCQSYCPLKLAQMLTGNRTLVYAGFYCAPPPSFLASGNDADKNRYTLAMRYYGLVEKLEGVRVQYATVKGTRGNLQEKNLDTKLTADMVRMAATNEYDTAIIVTNDADFVSAVVAAQEFSKKVEVVYFAGLGSMDLRQKCNIPRKAKPKFFQKIDGFITTDYQYVERQSEI